MDAETLRKIVEEAVGSADPFRLSTLLVVLLGVAITGFIGRYFAAYLQAKGKNVASKEDSISLLNKPRGSHT